MFELFNHLLISHIFQTKVKHLDKIVNEGHKILEQGKYHSCIYIILKGKVRIVVNESEQKNLLLHPGVIELGPESIFGEFALFDDSPASADVIAITECTLIEIDIDTLKLFLDQNPAIGYKVYDTILKQLVNRLRHANKTIVNLYVWGMKTHQIDKYLSENMNDVDK